MIKDVSEVAGLDLGIIGNCRRGGPFSTRRVAFCGGVSTLRRRSGVLTRLLAGKEEGLLRGRARRRGVGNRRLCAATTAIVETILKDAQGNALRITDYSPRFRRFERVFNPPQIFRRSNT